LLDFVHIYILSLSLNTRAHKSSNLYYIVHTHTQTTTTQTKKSTNITFDDIGTFPRRAGVGTRRTPYMIRFVSSNKLRFLQSSESGLQRAMYDYDLKTGTLEEVSVTTVTHDESTMTQEEKLRRERMRMLHTGVTSYQQRGDIVFVPIGNDLFIRRSGESSFKKILAPDSIKGSIVNPQISGDGQIVTFVNNNEVWTVPAKPSSKPTQLTSGHNETKTNGVASFIAQEEMDRASGFFVSQTFKNEGGHRFLAFEEVEEKHIPRFQINHVGSNKKQGSPPLEVHRYPFAGERNPDSRLGVLKFKDGKTTSDVVWFDFRTFQFDGKNDEEAYLARVSWLSETVAPKGALLVQLQDRRQENLVLLRANVSDGSCQVILRESRPKAWVNLHYMLVTLPSSNSKSLEFLWASEREEGFMHLFKVTYDNKTGKTTWKRLTSGKWVVESVVNLDATNKVVYFLGNKTSLLERHLYSVSYADDADSINTIKCLTKARKGMHLSIVFDSASNTFIDTYSTRTKPPIVCMCDVKTGKVLKTIYDASKQKTTQDLLKRMNLTTPQVRRIRSEDGHDDLYMMVYKPDESVHGKGPYPCIVSVYVCVCVCLTFPALSLSLSRNLTSIYIYT